MIKKGDTVIKQEIPQSNADELKKYKELLDSGIISQEEFDQRKSSCLVCKMSNREPIVAPCFYPSQSTMYLYAVVLLMSQTRADSDTFNCFVFAGGLDWQPHPMHEAHFKRSKETLPRCQWTEPVKTDNRQNPP